jgi:hypothetical protein
VLGSGLALALRAAGWRIEAPPGGAVEMRRDGLALQPFRDVAGLVTLDLAAERWLAECARLGIADLPLQTAMEGDQAVPDVSLPQTWVLLSSRCTRGWTRWGHGELWLSRSGLLWRRLGWRRTVLQSASQGGSARRGQRAMLDEADVSRLAESHPGNVWVRQEDIVRARLWRGIVQGRLRLQLANGRRIKLLFAVQDRADVPLRQALRGWLGDGLARS